MFVYRLDQADFGVRSAYIESPMYSSSVLKKYMRSRQVLTAINTNIVDNVCVGADFLETRISRP